MKRSQETICLLAAPLAVLLMLIAGAPAMCAEKSVTIEGEIEVAEYDDGGENPISVYIWDSEWYSVLISNEGKGKELMQYIGSTATVTGTITELEGNGDFDYVMKVASYTIEDSAEPEDYSEDEPDRDPEEER